MIDDESLMTATTEGLRRLGTEEEDPLDTYMRSLDGSAVHRVEGTSARNFTRRPREDATRIKNRRYLKLQELLRGSDYFSDENMERRCPSLYHFHLGKYKPLDTSTRAEPASLSSFLMASMDKQALGSRKQSEESSWGLRRQKQKAAQEDMTTMDDDEEFKEEFDSESDEEDDDEAMVDDHAVSDDEADDDMTLDEHRQQLIDIMCQRFLQGLDSDFTKYDDIDGNIEWDDMRTLQQDAEDAYFDT
ncbi:hypothetical protein ACHHYP_07215 [Achlya hypogyna]|uniref:CCD97-like C-terminal domain-containing protein n=1 Tax=Achlya hypogyna TaxID=1202772 RepID=A0A1V9ZN67_ACHHY|nr:hypothetical protein ACHHYP_07215 [Achlya hypogyna]